MSKYFYSSAADGIQQISDTFEAYALDKKIKVSTLDWIFVYTSSNSNLNRDILFDGQNLNPSNLDNRCLMSLTYYMNVKKDAVIMLRNPSNAPVYFINWYDVSDILYIKANSTSVSRVTHCELIKKRELAPDEKFAFISFVFPNAKAQGGRDYPDFTEAEKNAMLQQTGECEILVFNKITKIDTLKPFGFAVFDEKQKMLFCLDKDSRNLTSIKKYEDDTVFDKVTYATGETPDIKDYSVTAENLAVSVLQVPNTTIVNTGVCGEPVGLDTPIMYAAKLTKTEMRIIKIVGFDGMDWAVAKFALPRDYSSASEFPYIPSSDSDDGYTHIISKAKQPSYCANPCNWVHLEMDCTRFVE